MHDSINQLIGRGAATGKAREDAHGDVAIGYRRAQVYGGPGGCLQGRAWVSSRREILNRLIKQ